MTGTIRSSYHVRTRTRAYYAQQLPLPCPYCGYMVTKDQAWDLDHTLPIDYGGNDSTGVRPAHARCNRRGGAAITNAKKKFTKKNAEIKSAFFPTANAASRPAEQIFYVSGPCETADRAW